MLEAMEGQFLYRVTSQKFFTTLYSKMNAYLRKARVLKLVAFI